MSRTDIIDIVDGKWRGAEEYRASDMDVKRDLICDPARVIYPVTDSWSHPKIRRPSG